MQQLGRRGISALISSACVTAGWSDAPFLQTRTVQTPFCGPNSTHIRCSSAVIDSNIPPIPQLLRRDLSRIMSFDSLTSLTQG